LSKLAPPCTQLRQAAKYPDPALADSFVELIDGEFVLGCNRFPISGFNQWEVMEAAAGAPRLVGSRLPDGVTGPQLIRTLLDSAVDTGMTVVRAW
jgi:mannan endo-1,4-beta-mannosidase